MEVNKATKMEEQIQELKTITQLQEQCRALQQQSVKETTERNLATLAALHTDVRRGTLEWALNQRSDQQIISKACRRNLPLNLALSHSTLEVVREKLSKYVLDRVNVHNALLHLARQRGSTLGRLQLELARVQGQAAGSKDVQRQLQVIRQLENNIEKKLTLLTATQNIHLLYEHLRDHLKRMLCEYPSLLDRLQNKVSDYSSELSAMMATSRSAMKITDEAKRNLKKVQTAFMDERRAREQRLSQQKKFIDKIRTRDLSDKYLQQGEPDTDFSSLPSANNLRMRRESQQVDSQYQNSMKMLVEHVKSTVQCSQLWDITGRFLAQRTLEETLEVQMTECTEQQAEQQAQLQQLELEGTALKFSHGPASRSFEVEEGRVQALLREAQERLRLAHTSMVKRQQLLLTMEMGINNLYFRLPPLGMLDKLAYCEERLVWLAQRTQTLAQTEEITAKVRDALESSTLKETFNYRLRLKDVEDEDDMIESFQFSEADQSYVPSRAEIKNQAQELISRRLRGSKRKK